MLGICVPTLLYTIHSSQCIRVCYSHEYDDWYIHSTGMTLLQYYSTITQIKYMHVVYNELCDYPYICPYQHDLVSAQFSIKNNNSQSTVTHAHTHICTYSHMYTFTHVQT